MARALALAWEARGETHPNPPVGAVLVRHGDVVGEGRTQLAGGAHAEVVALTQAGERARASDLFVTLEPCAHWGRTPPCVDALIAAGIRSAHVALLDPNPEVNGQGLARLQSHGIETFVGEGAEEAAETAEIHLYHAATTRPFITIGAGISENVVDRLAREADIVAAAGAYDEMHVSIQRENVSSILFLARLEEIGQIARELSPQRLVAGPGVPIPPGYHAVYRVDTPSLVRTLIPTQPAVCTSAANRSPGWSR